MTTSPINSRATLRSRRSLLAALAGAAFATACGAQASPSSTSASASTDGALPVITVRASEFAFKDSTIRVQAGRPVRLVMDNAGAIEHDLEVVRLPVRDVRRSADAHGHGDDVAAHAAAGKQAWVEFTPTQKGTYDIECTLPGHKEAGMKGKLVVE
jgi:uncharacterized cupredoxin-like copper-binding protein